MNTDSNYAEIAADMRAARTRAARTIELAGKHTGNGAAMASSAVLAHKEASRTFLSGNYRDAHVGALRSLAYSVGIFHPDYTAAWDPADGAIRLLSR